LAVFRSLSTNPKVKELLKLVHICQSYPKIKVARFSWPTVYIPFFFSLKKEKYPLYYYYNTMHGRRRDTTIVADREVSRRRQGEDAGEMVQVDAE